MATRSKVEIVDSPNHLKARTSGARGTGLVSDQMTDRADTVIRDAAAEYGNVLRQDIAELTQFSQTLGKRTERDARLSKQVYRKAFDIKSQAGTFGYAVMTEIASSLCDFIEAMDEAKRPLAAPDGVAVAVLDMHVASLRLALDRNMTGPIGPQEAELVDGLVRVVRKTVGTATGVRDPASH
jgi:chemotaxis protein histidine kinase CheA